MRIERAIDAFLDWRQLERDATPRSIDSYRRILTKLAEDYPEAQVDALTTPGIKMRSSGSRCSRNTAHSCACRGLAASMTSACAFAPSTIGNSRCSGTSW